MLDENDTRPWTYVSLVATIVGGSSAPPACTPAAVCAPEIMFEQVTTSVITQPATTASDIWALACIVCAITAVVYVFMPPLTLAICADRCTKSSLVQQCSTLHQPMSTSWVRWHPFAAKSRRRGAAFGTRTKNSANWVISG